RRPPMTRSALASTLVLVAACGNPSSSPPPGGSDAGAAAHAIATSRDLANMSGAINLVDLASHAVQRGLDTTIDADNLVRPLVGNQALLLNKQKGTLRLYDPPSWAVLAEARLGDQDHKPDTAFVLDAALVSPRKVVVSLSGNDAAHA